VAESPAAKALLREKRGLSTSVDELIKKLGPDKVKELLQHEAKKVADKRPEPVVHYKPGNGKKDKQKPRLRSDRTLTIFAISSIGKNLY